MVPPARDLANLFRLASSKLWPACLLVAVLFFLLGGLYNKCSSCSSDVAWLSRRPPSDLPSSVIASDSPFSPVFAPLPEIRQQNNSEYPAEDLRPVIAEQDNLSITAIVNSPSQVILEEFVDKSKEDEGGLEGEKTDRLPRPVSEEFVDKSKVEDSELEREKTDQLPSPAFQKSTGKNPPDESRNEEQQGKPDDWQGSQKLTPADPPAELQDERKPPEPRSSELALLAAKEEIFFKNTPETDAVLNPAIYRNFSLFVRSYRTMEKMLKIFIYKDGSTPLFHTGPRTGIYSSEGRFISQLLSNSRFVTSDPKEAHLFFLPFSVTNMVNSLYVRGSPDMSPITDFITSYVSIIASKYPYWNLSHGADHFFLSCHDWGPAVARGHPELRQNAIKVVCNADLNEEFVVEKDVSLPETNMHALKPPTHLGGLLGRKRPYLAFFAGQMHGRVRPLLLKHWQNKFPDMRIFGRMPSAVARKVPYVRHMRLSKYCICPMGYEVNSPRIVEAIYYDCVPVIIADGFVLPFSEVLDWPAFSVSVNESEIPRLRDILLSIPEPKYRVMQANLKHVRQHFVWNFRRPAKYDIFHMILHSLWLCRLAALPYNVTL